MWIMLNDAFFSIVKKDCARDELLVRARRPGDIEKVFPEAKGRVVENRRSDYAYRAVVKTHVVKTAIDGEINRINYDNFKDTVGDDALHDAYMAVWLAMSKLQPTAPYSGFLLDLPPAKKSPGRSKGGRARAAKMTAAERSEQARRAANARWGKLS